jgi:hypothetical protein
LLLTLKLLAAFSLGPFTSTGGSVATVMFSPGRATGTERRATAPGSGTVAGDAAKGCRLKAVGFVAVDFSDGD